MFVYILLLPHLISMQLQWRRSPFSCVSLGRPGFRLTLFAMITKDKIKEIKKSLRSGYLILHFCRSRVLSILYTG